MTVSDVLDEVEQDSTFYRESGGGLTVSGECLLQSDFVAALLAEAHNRGINTAIETAGNVPWAYMARTPLIQGVNDVVENIRNILAFIRRPRSGLRSI